MNLYSYLSLLSFQELKQEIDEYRYLFQDLKRLASEITRDPKASDTTRVSDTITNLSKNWEVLEALLQRR